MSRRIYSKHLSPGVKQQFVNWFRQQPDALKYDMATTPFEAKTRIANLRRLMLSYFKAEKPQSNSGRAER